MRTQQTLIRKARSRALTAYLAFTVLGRMRKALPETHMQFIGSWGRLNQMLKEF